MFLQPAQKGASNTFKAVSPVGCGCAATMYFVHSPSRKLDEFYKLNLTTGCVIFSCASIFELELSNFVSAGLADQYFSWLRIAGARCNRLLLLFVFTGTTVLASIQIHTDCLCSAGCLLFPVWPYLRSPEFQ